jgi:hypothetical protein
MAADAAQQTPARNNPPRRARRRLGAARWAVGDGHARAKGGLVSAKACATPRPGHSSGPSVQPPCTALCVMPPGVADAAGAHGEEASDASSAEGEDAWACGAAGVDAYDEQEEEPVDEEEDEEDEDIRPRALPADGEPDFDSVRRMPPRYRRASASHAQRWACTRATTPACALCALTCALPPCRARPWTDWSTCGACAGRRLAARQSCAPTSTRAGSTGARRLRRGAA